MTVDELRRLLESADGDTPVIVRIVGADHVHDDVEDTDAAVIFRVTTA